MKYLPTGKILILICTFLFASISYAQDCGYLSVSIFKTEARDSDSTAAVVDEVSQIHGRIEFFGNQVVSNGKETQWIMYQNSFSGPEGNIVYSWVTGTPLWDGHDNERLTIKKCKIHYNQSYCGLLFWSAENKTTVEGACYLINEPGHSTIVFH